jgi:hypothetical protein
MHAGQRGMHLATASPLHPRFQILDAYRLASVELFPTIISPGNRQRYTLPIRTNYSSIPLCQPRTIP